MKVTQYTTNKDNRWAQNPVFPSVKMNGVKEVSRTDRVISDDFLGFGVAITGSSCYNLAQMPKEERTRLLTSIYGEEGLGLSVGRLSIGSSDYSPELYFYDDVAGDTALRHFSIERDEAYIIPMLREILAIRPDLYLYASPWSPPAWMKTGGSLGGGYMRLAYIDCYASYIVRFIEAYARHGIRISAITPQNEVENDQSGTMPACRWHPDIEAAFAIALRKKLAEKGLDVKIWIHDHCFSMWRRVKWMLDTHEGLADACDGIAFHYYEGTIEETLPLQAAYPTLPMHFTEGGPRLYDHYDTDWCKWGIMLTKTLNCGYRSFTGWNLLLDQTGGPNVGPFFCGGLITRHNVTNALSYSGQYAALSHFARFMQGGAAVYETVAPAPYPADMFSFHDATPRPLAASCVRNPDGSVCYFLVNAKPHKEQVQILEGGQWYYVELMPDTLSTIVFAPQEA